MKSLEKISILLADGHALFRRGLKNLIEENSRLSVVYEVSTGNEVLALANHAGFNIIIMDVNLPILSGIETLKEIRSLGNQIPILIMGITEQEEIISSCIKLGADGYFLKSEEVENLYKAIYEVAEGKKFISEKLTSMLFDIISKKNIFPYELLLSSRELDVLRLLIMDKNNREISKLLFVSENTIKTHIKHIFAKMGVKSRREAVKKAKLWEIN
ncbi:MAG: hypothetical protein CVU39_02145 [Chloroflexi bacterium HGW-Chloroflexi-10]|nr:MAG: hypothetical protein CVU39_02145 [Chloroflexi bacterium HGW-Chloroflexi-10]